MRDRLIELIQKSVNGCAKNWAEVISEYLLANGVIVPPCKVGDMVYFVIDDDDGEPFISSQRINDVSTRGIFVSDSLSEENCGCFVPFSDFGKVK